MGLEPIRPQRSEQFKCSMATKKLHHVGLRVLTQCKITKKR